MIPAYELALQRSHPQSSDVYLIVQQPQRYTDAEYVSWQEWVDFDYSCQVDGNPLGDPIATITVNGGSANVTLLDGMTVLIGSTLGEWDKAVVRLRGDQNVGPGTTTLDIATSSDIRGVVKDNDWIVVLDEFRLWQRYGRIVVDGGNVTWYKDYDILWDDIGAADVTRRLASLPPVPIMGPHAVKFLDPPEVNSQFWFDWQDSYAVAPGQATTSWDSWGEQDFAGNQWNSNAETPGWQDFLGISGLRGFRVRLEVDDGNGNAVTLPYRRGIRYVFTLRRPGQSQPGDPANAEPLTSFRLNSPVSGSFAQGYWRVSITVFEDEASKYTIMPGALIILFTDDWYVADDPYLEPRGLRNISVGPIFDRENILFVGRVAAGSIKVDPETQDLTFDAVSPGEEAASYENYPIVIEYDDDADDWIETPGLTVDMAVRHYIAWHTTMSLIADVYQTGDTHTILAQDFLQGAIYSTLNTFLWDRLFARLLGDRFGRFFCEIDVQMQTYGSVGTLWLLENTDWLDALAVRHYETDRCKAAECGGIIYAGGDDIVPRLSRAPGTFDKYRGTLKSSNALAITDQDEVNDISGRLLQYRNLEWEVDLNLAGHWRYCDIAPQRAINVDGGAAISTERGDITGRLIIRDVSMEYLERGCIFTSIRTESEETDGTPGVTIVIPEELPDIPPPERDPRPGRDPPGGGFEFFDTGRRIISCNKGVFVCDEIGDTPPVWYAVNAGLGGYIYCWKIFRDPWHWWTTGGAEKTMWGIFSHWNRKGERLYKHENFPNGTWQLMFDCRVQPAGVTPSLNDARGTIEAEDYIYLIAGKYGGGFCGFDVYMYRSVDGGLNWTNRGQIGVAADHCARPYPNNEVTWPHSLFHFNTAPHSGRQVFYFGSRTFVGGPDVWKTTNEGGLWINLGADMGNSIYIDRIVIPYVSPTWTDTDVMYWSSEIAARTDQVQRSEDAGLNFTSIANLPAANYQRGLAVNLAGMDRDVLYSLRSTLGASGSLDRSDDRGGSWVNVCNIPHKMDLANLYGFGDTALENFLSWSLSSSWMILVSTAGVVLNKTGNLHAVAAGIDRVTSIERDTLGTA